MLAVQRAGGLVGPDRTHYDNYQYGTDVPIAVFKEVLDIQHDRFSLDHLKSLSWSKKLSATSSFL
jgi:hypothetical protein